MKYPEDESITIDDLYNWEAVYSEDLVPPMKTVDTFLHMLDGLDDVPGAYVWVEENGCVTLSTNEMTFEISVGLTTYSAYMQVGPREDGTLEGIDTYHGPNTHFPTYDINQSIQKMVDYANATN
jgi:hypothetical protein